MVTTEAMHTPLADKRLVLAALSYFGLLEHIACRKPRFLAAQLARLLEAQQPPPAAASNKALAAPHSVPDAARRPGTPAAAVSAAGHGLRQSKKQTTQTSYRCGLGTLLRDATRALLH